MRKQEVLEIMEDCREFDFKLRAYNELLTYLLGRVDKQTAAYVNSALFRLAVGHIRGEQPLTWSFNGKRVIAGTAGTTERSRSMTGEV